MDSDKNYSSSVSNPQMISFIFHETENPLIRMPLLPNIIKSEGSNKTERVR